MKFTTEELLRNRPSTKQLTDATGDEELVHKSVVSADAGERLSVPSGNVFDTFAETSKAAGYTGDAATQAKQVEERKRTNQMRKEQRSPRYQDPKAETPAGEGKGGFFRNLFGGATSSIVNASWNAFAGTTDLFYGALEYTPLGLISKYGFNTPLTELSDQSSAWMRDVAKESDDAFGVSEEFRKSFLGKLQQGAGSIAPAILTAGMSSFGQLYTESINDSERSTGLRLDEMSEHAKKQALAKATVVGVVGGASELLGAKILGLTKFFKGGTKMLPKGKAVEMLKAGAGEVGTETFQGQFMDTMAVAIEGDDRQLWGEEMLARRGEEALMAMIIGTGVKGGTMQLEASQERSEIRAYIDANLDSRLDGVQMGDIGDAGLLPFQERTPYDGDGNLSKDVVTAIGELREAEKGDDPEILKEAQDKLSAAMKESSVARSVGGDQKLSKNLLKALDPIDGATDVDWNYISENFTDEQLMRHMHEITSDGDIVATAILAKNGNEQARKDYVEEMTVAKENDLLDASKFTPEEKSDQEREEAGKPVSSVNIDPLSIDQSDSAVGDYDATVGVNLTEEERAAYDAGAEERARISKQTQATIDWFDSRTTGVEADYTPMERRTGDEIISEMRAKGMTEEEIEAESLGIMTAAGMPELSLSNMHVEGEQMSNMAKGNEFNSIIALYGDADPLAVMEEYVHAETDREVAEGTTSYKKIAEWKIEVERLTSGKDKRGDSDEDLKEWLAEQVKARALGRREEAGLPQSFLDYIDSIIAKLHDLFTRANELMNLEAGGVLPEGFIETLDRQGSLDGAKPSKAATPEINRLAADAGMTVDKFRSAYPAVASEVDARQGTSFSLKELSDSEANEILSGATYIAPEDLAYAEITGAVVVGAYHASTHNIIRFSSDRANPENDLGRGIYATTSVEDANDNYLEDGGDLTSRVERRVEMLSESVEEQFDEKGRAEVLASLYRSQGDLLFASARLAEMDDTDAAREVAEYFAKKELVGDGGRIYPLYLPMSKPAVLGGAGETHYYPMEEMDTSVAEDYRETATEEILDEYEEREDAKTYYADEIQQRMVELAENDGVMENPLVVAIQEVSDQFDGIDSSEVIEELSEFIYEGGTLRDLEQTLRSSSSLQNLIDEGESSGEFINRLFQELGYDGIIDRTVDRKFGSARQYGQGMSGMDAETVHIILPIDTKNRPVSAFNPSVSYSLAPAPDTPEFKRWFGDSKVLDRNGKPLVSYHGTEADFDAFKLQSEKWIYKDTAGKNQEMLGESGYAHWFAPTPEGIRAGHHFGQKSHKGVIYPVYLSIRNPLIIDDDTRDVWQSILKMTDFPLLMTKEAMEEVKAEGYDGIFLLDRGEVFDGDVENVDEIIAFEPTQIKSATGNRGNFDATDPRISYSLAPAELAGLPNDLTVDEIKAKHLDFWSNQESEAIDKTQVTNTKNTMEYIIQNNDLVDSLPNNKALDVSAGLGLNAQVMEAAGLEVETTEPNSTQGFERYGFEPTYGYSSEIQGHDKYGLITNTAVLNVLPVDVRNAVVQDIGRLLAVDGTAVITTRDKGFLKDVLKNKANTDLGDSQVYFGQKNEYQKAFTASEFKKYVESVLDNTYGKGTFTVEVGNLKNNKGKKISPPHVVVTKNESTADATPSYSLKARAEVDANRSVSETIYHRNSQKFQDKVAAGIIRPKTPISNFVGNDVFFHAPDFAMAGSAAVDGETYVEGKGGVYYPVLFSEGTNFWASTRSAAEKMARDLNEISRRNGGKIYMGLVTSPADKMFSSTTVSRGVVDFFNIIAKNPAKYGLTQSELNRMIVEEANASEVVVKDQVKSFVRKLSVDSTLAENIKEIKDLLNPEDSTFGLRKKFIEKLTTSIANSLSPQDIHSRKYISKALTEIVGDEAKVEYLKSEYGLSTNQAQSMVAAGTALADKKHATFKKKQGVVNRRLAKQEKKLDRTRFKRKGVAESHTAKNVEAFVKERMLAKTTKLAGALLGGENIHASTHILQGKLSKASILQGLGEQMSEEFTKVLHPAGSGNVYAVIEYDGEVEAVETSDHESYPYAIRGISGGEVTVNILDQAYALSDIVEYSEDVEFTDSETKKVISQSKKGDSIKPDDLGRVMPASAGVTFKPLRVVEPSAESTSVPIPSYSLKPMDEESGERAMLDEEVEYFQLKESLMVGSDSTDQAITEAENTLNFLQSEYDIAEPDDKIGLKKSLDKQKGIVAAATAKSKVKASQADKDALNKAYVRAKMARMRKDARDKQTALTDSWKSKLADTVAKRTAKIKAKAEGDAEAVTEALKELEILQAQLPQDIRGRLGGFSKLASRSTDAGRKSFLLQRSEMMMRLMSKYAVGSHRRNLRKTLKPFGSRAKAADRKLAEKVGNKRRDMLRAAHYYANWEEGKAELKQSPHMDDDEFDAIQETFRGVMKGEPDPVSVYEASEAAKEIKAEGVFERKAFKEQRREDREALQEDAIEKALRGDRRKTEPQREKAEQDKGILARLWQAQGDFMSGLTESAELMMRRLDGARDGFFRKEFFSGKNGISASALRFKRMMANDGAEYLARLEASVFNGQSESQITSKLTSWGIAQDSGIRFSVEGERIESQQLSVQQAVTLRLLLQDRSLDTTFESKHEITDDNRAEVLAQIDSYIGEDGVAYSQALADLYAEYGVEVGAMFKRLEGYDLDLVENYSPLKRAVFGKDVEGANDPFSPMVETTAGGTSKGGALKSRVDTTTELRFLPADVLFGQHLEFKNRYLAFAPLEQKLRDTFHGSAKLKGAIDQKHGKDFSKRLYKVFDNILAGRIEGDSSKLTKVLSALRSRVSTSVLMIKPKITATQLGSIPAYADEMPAGEWLKYSARFYKNWYSNMNTMLQTDFLKDRLSNAQNQEILETMNRGRSLFPNASQWRTNSVNKLMFNVKFGDVGAIIIGGWPVYQYTYDQAIEGGASEPAAREAAEVAFTEASAVQQSVEIHTRSHFYRTSELGRALLLFRTSPMLYHGKVQASFREWSEAYVDKKDGKISKEEARKIAKASAKSVLIFHVILPQIYYAISSGFVGFWHDDEDVRKAYWLGAAATLGLGNLSAVPIAGGIAAYASGASSFTPTVSDAGGSALIDASMRMANVDWAEVDYDDLMSEDNEKAAKAILSMVDITTGYGSKTLFNMINGAMDSVDEMSPETVFQIVGWSEYTFK